MKSVFHRQGYLSPRFAVGGTLWGGVSASLASGSLSMGGLVLRAHRHSLSRSCAVKMCALSFLLLLFPMLAVMTPCHHGLLNLRNDRGK